MATDVSLDIDGDFDLGGYLFKDGVPFLHNDGGAVYGNTALGVNALTNATLIPNYPYATKGAYNTAFGYNALQATTDGFSNTAVGWSAMRANTIGYSNTALGAGALGGSGAFYNSGHGNTVVGHFAMTLNEEGNLNTAVGAFALQQPGVSDSNNTAIGSYALFSTSGDNNVGVGYLAAASGSNSVAVGASARAGGTQTVVVGFNAGNTGIRNTAVGYEALKVNTGNHNTAVGYKAGQNWTTGTANIALGNGAYGVAGETQTIRIGGEDQQIRTFIEGIRGAASDDATFGFDQAVCTDQFEQLGTCTPSTARLKTGIEAMTGISEKVAALQPVTFRYKNGDDTVADRPLQYGLIAEEVAEVFPTLVSRDDEGRLYTVRYELLTPMLLKELQDEKQRREAEVEDLRRQVAELRKVVGDLKRREEIQRE